MTFSTGALIWMYGVINGTEAEERSNGDVRKVRSEERNGGVKGKRGLRTHS